MTAGGVPPARAGLVVVDKPEGPTSHDVVARVKRALGGIKVGHVGTLDPFASGVLPLLLGAATRLAPWYSGLPKSYEATLRLGQETDSLDRTGQVVREASWEHVRTEALRDAVTALRGPRDQVAPMFSARKVGGRRLHELARQGREVARPARQIEVFEAELLGFDGVRGTVEVRVLVSAGTYVRVLAQDLGNACGTAAHLSSLRRLAVGGFTLDGAVSLEEDGLADRLEAATRSGVALLPELLGIRLDAAAAGAVSHCHPVRVADDVGPVGASVRLLGPDGDLWAIADTLAEGHVQPRVVLRAAADAAGDGRPRDGLD